MTRSRTICAAILMAAMIFLPQQAIGQNNGGVGIGTGTPDPSAILDASSTTKGLLPPRMTTPQRDAIASPAVGLTLYNTTSLCLETWDGSTWFGPCSIVAAQYPVGTVFCNSVVTKVVQVLNPATGKTWMDRNLGASQVATDSTDANAYGDLYQWGRGADGHQCRNSDTTFTLSSTDQPGHGNFILAPDSPNDWRSPQNDGLWQVVDGVNNPCPTGYRLPTDTELDEERMSWNSLNAAGAFASPLKLPVAGYRANSSGSLFVVGSSGYYWSSTVSSTNSCLLYFSSSNALMGTNLRAYGLSVRCLKD